MLFSIYHKLEVSLAKLDILHHVTSLAGRIYVAKVFFVAGLLKIKDWETTLFLFEEEYQVPVLSPTVAAYLGTLGELCLPILLFLGLSSRFAALGLSVVNIIAVISLEDIAAAALYLHVIWGVLLLQIAIYGPGFASFDHFFKNLNKRHLLKRSALGF